MPAVKILLFCGSLRKASFNRMLTNHALEVIGDRAEVQAAEIGGLPLYNQDIEADALPESVQRLNQQVAWADRYLFITPEYNYSIPGVLKNAIDWASRPRPNPFANKKAAIMSASPGMLGGARCQYHLRQCFVFLDLVAITSAEVFVSFAADKFDENGKLKDDRTANAIDRLLGALLAE